MNKYDKNTKIYNLLYLGVEYVVAIDDSSIGVRRADQKDPCMAEVEKVHAYVLAEGFAEHLNF